MIRWIETLAERVPEHTPAGRYPDSSAQGSDETRGTAGSSPVAAPIPSLLPVSGNAAGGPPREFELCAPITVDTAELRPRRRSAPKHRSSELPAVHYAELLLPTAEGQELIAARRAVRGCPVVERQVGTSAEGASYVRTLADVPGDTHPAIRYREAQRAAELQALELGMPADQWLAVSIALDTDDAALVRQETIRIELPKPVFKAPPLPPMRSARGAMR